MNVPLFIERYSTDVRRAVELLHREIGRNRLSLGRGVGFDREGTFDGGETYRFHGRGCEVTFVERSVDFDFDDEGNYGGVDAWRLFDYMCQFSGEAPVTYTFQQVKDELERLALSSQLEAKRVGGSIHYYRPGGLCPFL